MTDAQFYGVLLLILLATGFGLFEYQEARTAEAKLEERDRIHKQCTNSGGDWDCYCIGIKP